MRRVYRFTAVLIAVGTVIFSAWMIRASALGDYRPDYSVFWTATHVVFEAPDRLYNSAYMTEAQSWLAAPWHGPRPYAYPPSALLLFLPFSVLPFWASFVAWNAISVSAFVGAARTYARIVPLTLAMLAPPTILALALGQTGIIIGAAAMFGIARMNNRPILGGLVLGVAAGIKPQAFVLAPIILSDNRKALGSFVLGGGAMVLLSLPLGPRLWFDWVAAVPEFMRAIDKLGLVRWGATPATLATWLRLDSDWTVVVRGAGIVAGVALAILARKGTKSDRLVALIAGGILCSPYAMSYDMAALMPVAATALFSETFSGLLTGFSLIGFGAITLPTMAAAAVWRRRPAFGSKSSGNTVPVGDVHTRRKQ